MTQLREQTEVERLEAAAEAANDEVTRIRQAIIDGDDSVTAQQLIDAEVAAVQAAAVLAVTRELQDARAAKEAEEARLARRASYIERVAPYVAGGTASQTAVASAYDEAQRALARLAEAVDAYNAETEPLRRECSSVTAEAVIDVEYEHQPHRAEERRTLPSPPGELRASQALATAVVAVTPDPVVGLAAGGDIDWDGVLKGQSGPYYEAARAAYDAHNAGALRQLIAKEA